MSRRANNAWGRVHAAVQYLMVMLLMANVGCHAQFDSDIDFLRPTSPRHSFMRSTVAGRGLNGNDVCPCGDLMCAGPNSCISGYCTEPAFESCPADGTPFEGPKELCRCGSSAPCRIGFVCHEGECALPKCPAGKISNLQTSCTCGEVGSETVYCENGGRCNGEECTYPACAEGFITQDKCSCDVYTCEEGEICKGGECVEPRCPVGQISSFPRECACGLSSCSPGDTCLSHDSGLCTNGEPDCTFTDGKTPVSENCVCTSSGSSAICGKGSTCDRSIGCKLPKCDNDNIVSSFPIDFRQSCQCGNSSTCLLSQTCDETTGTCGYPACRAGSPSTYPCQCSGATCDGKICDGNGMCVMSSSKDEGLTEHIWTLRYAGVSCSNGCDNTNMTFSPVPNDVCLSGSKAVCTGENVLRLEQYADQYCRGEVTETFVFSGRCNILTEIAQTDIGAAYSFICSPKDSDDITAASSGESQHSVTRMLVPAAILGTLSAVLSAESTFALHH